ncbi:MAG: hypothetical protein ACTSUE_13330 [Promethearchaeota archaeon]
MRIRRKKTIKVKALAVTIIIIFPAASFWGLTGWIYKEFGVGANKFAMGSNLHYNTTGFQTPNNSTYQLLEDMAFFYEQRLHEYHLPLNISSGALFYDDNLSSLNYYYGNGDGACWTGHTLAAEAYHYAVAKASGNETWRLNAMGKLKSVLNGTAMLLAVPNGGIGPNYSCILARYFCPPYLNSGPYRVMHDSLFGNPEMHNGSGIYSDWRYNGHASRDQHSGLMLGLGRAWELAAMDDAWVNETIRLLVEQLIDGLQATGWEAFDGDGTPTGTHMFSTFPASGAYWCLGLLQLGKNVNPAKYSGLYYHYAIERNLIGQLEDTNAMVLINSYYANNIHVAGYFNLIAMEEDPILKALYLNKFKTRFYDVIRYHRNGWFNVAWLALSGEQNATIEADIVDQLMRFYPNHYPNVRNYTNPRPAWHQIVPNHELLSRLTSTPFGPSFEFFIDMFNINTTVYYQPATIDIMDVASSNFIWQRCPFDPWDESGVNPRQEMMSIDYLLVYWMCRYLGILPGA